MAGFLFGRHLVAGYASKRELVHPTANKPMPEIRLHVATLEFRVE